MDGRVSILSLGFYGACPLLLFLSVQVQSVTRSGRRMQQMTLLLGAALWPACGCLRCSRDNIFF
jgi:hypothetical protein